MAAKHEQYSGFTIVELLIVIVVIGILAAITIVAYNGVQDRANGAKIQADLNQFTKATQMARINEAKVLGEITGSWYTALPCLDKASGTDLATLDKSDACWASYLAALDAISTASGVDIRNLTDPWGRPYAIDENEGRNADEWCLKDRLRTYHRPHANMSPDTKYSIQLPNYLAGCS